MSIQGSRQGGVATQLAVLKFIPNSTAPDVDPTGTQTYDAGEGINVLDKDGFAHPQVIGADGAGVVFVDFGDTPFQLTELHRRVLVNTTDGAVTVLLPDFADVSNAHEIEFIDSARTFQTNNLTVDGNGTNINGAATLVASRQDQRLVLVRGASSWEFDAGAGGSGGPVSASSIGTDGANQHPIPSGTAALATTDNAGDHFQAGSNATADVIGAGTAYLGVFKTETTVSATPTEIGKVARGTTLRFLSCGLRVAPGGTDTAVFTVIKSTDRGATWSDTTMIATLTGTDVSALTIGPLGAVGPGDMLDVKVVSSAGTAAGPAASFVVAQS